MHYDTFISPCFTKKNIFVNNIRNIGILKKDSFSYFFDINSI